MKNNISIINNCFGCSVCTTVCPKHIIKFHENKDGFYQPYIENEDKCIDCGRCLKVCSFEMPFFQSRNFVHGYATWSKDPAVRRKSSSGGTGFEVARYLMSIGYKVIGVRYNAELQRAEHYIATTVENLTQSMGSKYIQSYPEEAFNKIQKGNKYLVTGTPCQIASIRKMINLRHLENDIVLMDFFCHGVPSKLVWDKYVSEQEENIGKITYASWRNKQFGWHDSYNMLIKGKKVSITKKRSEGDIFYKLFLGDMCFNSACYEHCHFKAMNSAADIRIGDLWGSTYSNNEEGITGVITFTERGKNVIENSDIYFKQEPIDVVLEGQQKERINKPYYYKLLLKLLRIPLPLSLIYRMVQFLRIGTILRYKLHLK